MAICEVCGEYYDEDTVSDEFDEYDYIIENNLTGAYPNAHGRCAECAVELVMQTYPIGLEILGWLHDDD